MATGAVRRKSDGEEARIGGPWMGAAAGDTLPRINGGVSEPLRLELDGGELEPGRANDGVAVGGGAGVQCEDGGGGDGGVRGDE